jgi:hypothetical protein
MSETAMTRPNPEITSKALEGRRAVILGIANARSIVTYVDRGLRIMA